MTEKDMAADNADNGDTAEEETALESSIIRQVEYYFGDANLHRDKFLREQGKLDEGWIPLEVLTKFNRLAKLSMDLDVIATALNKSTSGLLEISEDNKKVRRNPELPVPEMNEDRRKELLGRTVYAKGFPKDASLDDLLKFFKGHGDVENVVMRRYLEKTSKIRQFKGSVFATFKVKDEAVKFLEAKDTKYGESELVVRWQDDYLKEKQEEYLARKEKKDKKHKDTESKQEKKEEFTLPTGTVLHFTEGDEKMTREDIKDALTKLDAEIAFIDFKVGDKEGWVRLTKEDAAKQIFPKIPEGQIKIGDSDVKFRLVEGDEEKAYLEKTVQEMSNRRRNQKNNKHNKGGGYKGKRHFGGKKRRHDNSDGPPAKVKAAE